MARIGEEVREVEVGPAPPLVQPGPREPERNVPERNVPERDMPERGVPDRGVPEREKQPV